MNIILVVVLYTVSSLGGFNKTEFSQAIDTLEQCELAAIVIKADKQLNDIDSFVFSAKCEVKRPRA